MSFGEMKEKNEPYCIFLKKLDSTCQSHSIATQKRSIAAYSRLQWPRRTAVAATDESGPEYHLSSMMHRYGHGYGYMYGYGNEYE